jgi:hypothetical protein
MLNFNYSNLKKNGKKSWFRPGSNRGPSACKADVITATPRNQATKPVVFTSGLPENRNMFCSLFFCITYLNLLYSL